MCIVNYVARALFCAYVLKLSCFYVSWFTWLPAYVEQVKLVGAGASSTRKKDRGILEVPKASDTKGWNILFGLKVVDQDGKLWYRSHEETKY